MLSYLALKWCEIDPFLIHGPLKVCISDSGGLDYQKAWGTLGSFAINDAVV
jgi:hypothetical protein